MPDEAAIVIGGDIVAGGSHPAETLERLRGMGDRVRMLRGNSDRELDPNEPGLAPPGALDATRAALSDEQIAFLFADVDADVVVCGHTHMQFDRTIAGKRVVNSGSVGSPCGDEPGAFWTLDLEPRRTEYGGMQAPEMNREERFVFCAPLEVRE